MSVCSTGRPWKRQGGYGYPGSPGGRLARHGASTAGFVAVYIYGGIGGRVEFLKVVGFLVRWAKKIHAGPPGRLSRVLAARVMEAKPLISLNVRYYRTGPGGL